MSEQTYSTDDILAALRENGLDIFEPDPLCSERFKRDHAARAVREALTAGLNVPAEMVVWADDCLPFGKWIRKPQIQNNNLDRGQPWPEAVYKALGTKCPEPYRTWEEKIDFSHSGKGWDY